MEPCSPSNRPAAPSRREFLAGALGTALAVTSIPSASQPANRRPIRAVNVMNFMRGDEPRVKIDLMESVRHQMELIKSLSLPATWLLQYDALVDGPFVEYLKHEMRPDHEVGLWFEMNRRICDDAGLEWRGNPDWEWDYHVPVAYSIGYTPEERRKLVDTAAATFKRLFNRDLKSVASWNLDAVSVAHFADRHGVDVFANCRDQLATDGFTIWGAPIAGYYPSRVNAWSPALDRNNQIPSPIFRLLGQDPVYYYDNTIPTPDTMEPGWPSGRSDTFCERFLDMIAHAPAASFSYAQLGQENSFQWKDTAQAYRMQMELLAKLREAGELTVETMGETGRRFKRAFRSTPPQAQVMLTDPFAHTEAPERTIWYQSRYYRANLHFRGSQFYLRDIHIYSDRFPQPFLTETVREHGIEQRLLAVLDGFHWSDEQARKGGDGRRAMGRFILVAPDGGLTQLKMEGGPTAADSTDYLRAVVPISGGATLLADFREKHAEFSLADVPPGTRLGLEFAWDPAQTAFRQASGHRIDYRFRDFDYSVRIANGQASSTETGVRIVSTSARPLRLVLAQAQ